MRGKDLQVELKPRHLAVGIRGNPPYLDVSRARSLDRSIAQPRAGPLRRRAPPKAEPPPALPCLQRDLGGAIKPSESYWTLGAPLANGPAARL